jgi:hypothetical protein
LLLLLHEPYRAPEHPVPINATVVHCLTLLHPMLPQPGGGRLYRALVDHQGRAPGLVVPLSTLTSEVGGNLALCTPDWEDVVDAVVALARAGRCDALPLGLPQVSAALLSMGPEATLTVHGPSGLREVKGPADRQQVLTELSEQVNGLVAQGPL